MDNNFCQRTEALAKKHGYHSVKVLLNECDISTSAFYRWKREGEGGPSAAQVVRLAEKLHTSVEWLMSGTRPANSRDMTRITKLTEQVIKLMEEIRELTEPV